MRAVGVGMLVLALAVGGSAVAHDRTHHGPPTNLCYRVDGTAYKPGDYCYTSCAPATACEVEMCFADGTWMKLFACKQRDCRKLC